jgi:hypothetical protein
MLSLFVSVVVAFSTVNKLPLLEMVLLLLESVHKVRGKCSHNNWVKVTCS